MPEGLRVLVCGGRSYGAFGNNPPGSPRYAEAFGERGIMCRALDEAKVAGMTALIHGGASGADAYGKRWAKDHGVEAIRFYADWDDLAHPKAVIRYRKDGTPYNAAAGPIRNARMLEVSKPDLVIAFPGGAGTQDMIRRARAAGIEVREVG